MQLTSSDLYDLFKAEKALERISNRHLENIHFHSLYKNFALYFAQTEQKYLKQSQYGTSAIRTLFEIYQQKNPYGESLRAFLDDLSIVIKKLAEKMLQKGQFISDAFQSDYELKIGLIAFKTINKVYNLDQMHENSSFNFDEFNHIESTIIKKLNYNINLTGNIHHALTHMFYIYWQDKCKEDYQVFLKKCQLIFNLRQIAEENAWPISYPYQAFTEENYDTFLDIFEFDKKLKGYTHEILEQLKCVLNMLYQSYGYINQGKTRYNFICLGLQIIGPNYQSGLSFDPKAQYAISIKENKPSDFKKYVDSLGDLLTKIAQLKLKEINFKKKENNNEQDHQLQFIHYHLLSKRLFDLIYYNNDSEQQERYKALLDHYPMPEENKLCFDILNDHDMKECAIINNFFLRSYELLKLQGNFSNPFSYLVLSYGYEIADERKLIIEKLAKLNSISHLLAFRNLWFQNKNFLNYGFLKTSKHWSVTPKGDIVRISERNSRINLLCAIKILWLMAKKNDIGDIHDFNDMINNNKNFLFLKYARRTYLSNLEHQTSSIYQKYCQFLKSARNKNDQENMLNYLENRWQQHLQKIDDKLKIQLNDIPINFDEILIKVKENQPFYQTDQLNINQDTQEEIKSLN